MRGSAILGPSHCPPILPRKRGGITPANPLRARAWRSNGVGRKSKAHSAKPRVVRAGLGGIRYAIPPYGVSALVWARGWWKEVAMSDTQRAAIVTGAAGGIG